MFPLRTSGVVLCPFKVVTESNLSGTVLARALFSPLTIPRELRAAALGGERSVELIDFSSSALEIFMGKSDSWLDDNGHDVDHYDDDALLPALRYTTVEIRLC